MAPEFDDAARLLLGKPGLAQLVLMVSALVFGGSLMAIAGIPTLSKFIMKPTRRTKLSDHIPLRHPLQDGRLITGDNGQLSAVIKLDGKPTVAMSRGDRQSLYQRRKQWLDRFAGKGIHVRIFTNRHPIRAVPDSTIERNELANSCYQLWHSRFEDALVLSHYLVLSTASSAVRARETLEEQIQRALDELAPYRPVLLTANGSDGRASNIEFWQDYVNPQNKGPVRAMKLGEKNPTPINEMIVHGEIEFDTSTGLISFNSGGENELHAYVVPVTRWGDSTTESLLQKILALPGRMTVMQNITVPDRAVSQLAVKRAGDQAKIFGFSKYIQADVEEAMDAARPDTEISMALIEHEMNVIVYGRSPEEARRLFSDVKQVFIEEKLNTRIEREIAQPIYFAAFPGYDQKWRSTRMFSANVAQLVNFTAAPAGVTSCDFGAGPVILYPTDSGDPYPFCFHESEKKESIGHTVIIGRSGSGKTTAAMIQGVFAMRYPRLRLFVFDRDFGCLIPTLAFGGRYMTFQDSKAGLEAAYLNFLQLPDTDANRTHVVTMLQMLTGLSDPESLSKFGVFVGMLPNFKPETRTLGAIYSQVAAVNSEIQVNLKPWISEERGPLGGIFDGGRGDQLPLDCDGPITFDMTAILENEKAAAPVVWDIFHRIDQELMTSGDPGIILVDETAPLLANEIFRKKWIDALQRGRKKRVVLASMFQEPDAVDKIDAQAAAALRKNTANWIFFPNAGGTLEQYKNWDLTDTEWAFIKMTLPHVNYAARPMLIKKREIGESVIVYTDYSAMGEYAALFKSGKEFWQLALQLRQAHPESWVDIYLERVAQMDSAFRR